MNGQERHVRKGRRDAGEQFDTPFVLLEFYVKVFHSRKRTELTASDDRQHFGGRQDRRGPAERIENFAVVPDQAHVVPRPAPKC